MSELTDRITEVLRDNLYQSNMSCCKSTWDHAAHVAERVEAELQLTEETVVLNEYAAQNGAPAQVQRRWVSAWSEVTP